MKARLKYYYMPTPIRIKRVGDSILYGSTVFIPVIMGSPLSDHHKSWGVTIFALFGALGKFVSNLFTDTPNENTPNVEKP